MKQNNYIKENIEYNAEESEIENNDGINNNHNKGKENNNNDDINNNQNKKEKNENDRYGKRKRKRI